MWGRRKKQKRCGQLSRQLALGRLEDALAVVEEREQQQPEPETAPYPEAPARSATPPGSGDLQAGDVPADTSADVPTDTSAHLPAGPCAGVPTGTSADVTGPGSRDQAAADDDQPPRQAPAPRTARSARHRSFG
jgi:hypothetical protein